MNYSIIPPRAAWIDPATGSPTIEFYKFISNLFTAAGDGQFGINDVLAEMAMNIEDSDTLSGAAIESAGVQQALSDTADPQTSPDPQSVWLAEAMADQSDSFGGSGVITDVLAGTGIAVSTAAFKATVSLATVANNRILANISGGVAAPAPDTLTAILDAIIGSARGDMLYRDATTWGATTLGTSGYVWRSNGTDALWAAIFWGIFNVRDYGAVGDGTADDTAAVNAAITALLAAGGGVLYFPTGEYKLTSQITITYTGTRMGITVRGDGPASVLKWTASGGFKFVMEANNGWIPIGGDPQNSLAVSDMALRTKAGGAGGPAIRVQGGSISGRPVLTKVFRNLWLASYDQFTDYWTIGFDFVDCAETIIDGCQIVQGGPGNFSGIGIKYSASGAGIDPTSHKIINTQVAFGNTAVQAGNYIEGVYIEGVEFVNLHYGIDWQTSTVESTLAIRNFHINADTCGILLTKVFDSAISGGFIANFGPTAGWTGIQLSGNGNITVTDNVINGSSASGTTGIACSGDITGLGGRAAIASNAIENCVTGIYLGVGSKGYQLSGNAIGSCTTSIYNDSAAFPSSGLPDNSIARPTHLGALVFLNANQLIADDGFAHPISFTDVVYDTFGLFSGGSPTVFTIPAGFKGLAKVTAQLAMITGAGTSQVQGRIRKNGSAAYAGGGRAGITAATDFGSGTLYEPSSGPWIPVAPGDTLELAAFQVSGGGAINAAGAASGNATWMSIELRG